MKITEILQLEKSNEGQIFLIKEGCFWRAYEKSAFRFSRLIRDFKITKKWIKYLNQEIVSIGFPLKNFEEIFKKRKDLNLKILRQKETVIVLGKCLDGEDFQKWKAVLKQENIKNEKQILDSIRKFPTIQKTPLEAMRFLTQLQVEIKENY